MTTAANLLAPSDIATLAGVSRAAVSNWRKRHEGFPAPTAGTDKQPLFDSTAVREWLEAKGYSITTPDLAHVVWTQLNTWRGPLRIEEMIPAVLVLLAAQKLGILIHHDASGASAYAAALAREVARELDFEPIEELARPMRTMGDHPRRLAETIDAFRSLPTEELGRIADDLIGRERSSRRSSSTGLPGSRIAEVFINAPTDLPEGALVYDPACGRAVDLIGLAKTHPGKHVQLRGNEINRSVAAEAKLRAFLHDIDIDITVSDTLQVAPGPGCAADVVICEPPFNARWEPNYSDRRWQYGLAPRSNSTLAWIQAAIAQLKPTGRGYVTTPMGALFLSGAHRDIRAQLIGRGCVEAIVALPPKLLTDTAIPVALWVVRPPQTEATDVLFINATQEPEPENRIGQWLNETIDLPPHRRVPVVEIITENADLNPEYWTRSDIGTDVEGASDQLKTALQALTTAKERLNTTPFPDFAPLALDTRRVVIGDLVTTGMASMRRLRRTETASIDRDDPRVVRPSDLKVGALPAPPTGGNVPDPGLTEPGSVLVCTTGDLYAAYDPHGGHLHQDWIIRLKPDPERLDPAYLAALIAQPWNRAFLTGTTIQRADINRLEIPLPPIEEQRRIGEQLQKAHALIAAAESLAEATQNATDSYLTTLVASD